MVLNPSDIWVKEIGDHTGGTELANVPDDCEGEEKHLRDG
jgi:hypothetical protein